jgi:antitoxin Phd
MDTWTSREAKAKFCALVEKAASGTPQLITRHGKPVAVALSAEEYEKRLRELKSCE